MRALPLLFLWLAVGCSKPDPPTITPDSATVSSVDAQGVHLTVTLDATNPNKVDLPVQDATAHVVLAGKMDLCTSTLPQAVNLPAGKPTKLQLPVVMLWSDVVGLAEMAAIELIVIDDATTVTDIKKELRWNQAYHQLARGL